jgi:hypothetical protein
LKFIYERRRGLALQTERGADAQQKGAKRKRHDLE